MTNYDVFIQSDSSCLSQIDTLLTTDKCLSPSDTVWNLGQLYMMLLKWDILPNDANLSQLCDVTQTLPLCFFKRNTYVNCKSCIVSTVVISTKSHLTLGVLVRSAECFFHKKWWWRLGWPQWAARHELVWWAGWTSGAFIVERCERWWKMITLWIVGYNIGMYINGYDWFDHSDIDRSFVYIWQAFKCSISIVCIVLISATCCILST